MISLSTQTANINGSLVIDEDIENSDFGNQTARVSRVKTLDGGVVITHSGVSDGDRTFNIKAEISQTAEATALYLFKNFQLVNISVKDGFFAGAIDTCNIKNGSLDMRILVKE